MALGTGQLYDDLEDLGLHCGPTFQALKNVSFNVEGEATAAINVHEWKNKTSQPTLQPYLIHPTALDGVLQLMFPALTNGMRMPISNMVPTRVQSIWISGGASMNSHDDEIAVRKCRVPRTL